MKNLIKIIFFAVAIFVTSCSNSQKEVTPHEPYSIFIENFNKEFDKSISALNTIKLDTIYIPQKSVNSVVLGYFSSINEAKSTAENLILDSLISDYKLVKNDTIKTTFNSKFQFIGLFKEIPAIYNYDFETQKFDLVWGEWGRNVYGLYPDFDKNVSYFLTSLSWGRRGGIPYILKARMYHLDNLTGRVNRKKIFGKGNLMNGFWLNDNFQVYFYALDSVKTSIITRVAIEYDWKGKEISSDSTQYNLLDGSFPLPPKKNLNFFSPSNRFRIMQGIKDSLNTISIYNEVKGDSSAVFYTKEELMQIEWSFDDHFTFLKTAKLINDEEKNSIKSTLIIYDNQNEEIVYQINGEGIKNFFIFGDTIVYDDGLEKDSKIYFYDFRKHEMLRIVEHDEGLGVFTYPQIPD